MIYILLYTSFSLLAGSLLAYVNLNRKYKRLSVAYDDLWELAYGEGRPVLRWMPEREHE